MDHAKLGDCFGIVICNVLQYPFSRTEEFWDFSASIKLGYTCDNPAHNWEGNINLSKIYVLWKMVPKQLVSKRLVGMKKNKKNKKN